MENVSGSSVQTSLRCTILPTGLTIDVDDGETILAAALRCGVEIAFGCTVGDCGACKVALLSGSVMQYEAISSTTLSQAERELGTLLACMSELRTEVTVSLLPDDGFRFHPERVVQTQVLRRRSAGRGLVEIDLEPVTAGLDVSYSPGQYAILGFAGASEVQAFFSRPGGTNAVRCVLHDDFNFGIGETVVFRGPFGSAYLRERFAGPIILAAEGIGVAAIIAILESLALRPPLRQLLVYLECESWTTKRIAEICLRQPQLRLLMISEIARSNTNLAEWSAYVFGNFDFVGRIICELEKRDISMANLYSEIVQKQ